MNKIKNPIEILTYIQGLTSKGLSYIDSCESVIKAVYKIDAGGDIQNYKEHMLKGYESIIGEIQEYRGQLLKAYKQAENYLVYKAEENGEKIEVKGTPISLAYSYESEIANIDDTNKDFVLNVIEQKLQAILKKPINKEVKYEEFVWSGPEKTEFDLTLEEAVGITMSHVEVAINRFKKMGNVRYKDK